jgi:hypothetical protein
MAINRSKAPTKVLPLYPLLWWWRWLTNAAVLSNIHAVHELTEIVRTSLGPNGRLKLVVNHLGKQALTNNSSTILKEIDVVHPAAKLLVMASQQQEAEVPITFFKGLG